MTENEQERDDEARREDGEPSEELPGHEATSLAEANVAIPADAGIAADVLSDESLDLTEAGSRAGADDAPDEAADEDA